MVFMVWAYHKLGDLWYLWFWANHKLFNLWYAILDLWRGTPQVLPMSTFEPIRVCVPAVQVSRRGVHRVGTKPNAH